MPSHCGRGGYNFLHSIPIPPSQLKPDVAYTRDPGVLGATVIANSSFPDHSKRETRNTFAARGAGHERLDLGPWVERYRYQISDSGCDTAASSHGQKTQLPGLGCASGRDVYPGDSGLQRCELPCLWDGWTIHNSASTQYFDLGRRVSLRLASVLPTPFDPTPSSRSQHPGE